MEIYRLVESSGTPPDAVFLRVLSATLSKRPDLLRQVKLPLPRQSAARGQPDAPSKRTSERREHAREGARESSSGKPRQVQTKPIRAKDEAPRPTKEATAKPAVTSRKEKAKADQDVTADEVIEEESMAAEVAPKPAPKLAAPLRRRWTEEEKRARKAMPKKRASRRTRAEQREDVDEFDEWQSGQSS